MKKIHMYKKDIAVTNLSKGTAISRRMYCGIEWDIHWPGQNGHMTQNSSIVDCKSCISSLDKGKPIGYSEEETNEMERKFNAQ